MENVNGIAAVRRHLFHVLVDKYPTAEFRTDASQPWLSGVKLAATLDELSDDQVRTITDEVLDDLERDLARG